MLLLKMATMVWNVFWETELYNIYVILHSDVHSVTICTVYWLCSVNRQ